MLLQALRTAKIGKTRHKGQELVALWHMSCGAITLLIPTGEVLPVVIAVFAWSACFYEF